MFCSILTNDDETVITGGADSSAKLISLESGRVLKSFHDHTGPVVALALTSYSEFLITGKVLEGSNCLFITRLLIYHGNIIKTGSHL